MFGLGMGELIIILLVVVVLFGTGKISKLMGEVGQGVKAFKDGMAEGSGAKPVVVKTSMRKTPAKTTRKKKSPARKKSSAK